jgi:hypothetical protein
MPLAEGSMRPRLNVRYIPLYPLNSKDELA